MSDDVRDEADQLVSAVLAAISFATRGLGRDGRPLADLAGRLLGDPDGGGPDRGASDRGASDRGASDRGGPGRGGSGRDGAEREAAGPDAGEDRRGVWAHLATGSPECCVCPVCRAISALRDPSPEVAERLASGAGDVAAGVTTILRTVSGMMSRPPARRPRADRPPSETTSAATWRAATRAGDPRPPADRPRPVQPDDDDPWSGVSDDEFPLGTAGTGVDGGAHDVSDLDGEDLSEEVALAEGEPLTEDALDEMLDAVPYDIDPWRAATTGRVPPGQRTPTPAEDAQAPSAPVTSASTTNAPAIDAPVTDAPATSPPATDEDAPASVPRTVRGQATPDPPADDGPAPR